MGSKWVKHTQVLVELAYCRLCLLLQVCMDLELIIIIIYTTYIAPYIWPVWPFIGAEEGPSKY